MKELSGEMRKALDELQPRAEEKRLLVESSLAECRAKVNPFIRNVFSNLLSNAIKYSPRGERVEVELTEEVDECRFRVSDRGEGVADEHKQRIFQRFERGSKQGVKGTGLGLAIVKRVVELHGGKVWVEDNTAKYRDREGKVRRKRQGAVFVVELKKS